CRSPPPPGAIGHPVNPGPVVQRVSWCPELNEGPAHRWEVQGQRGQVSRPGQVQTAVALLADQVLEFELGLTAHPGRAGDPWVLRIHPLAEVEAPHSGLFRGHAPGLGHLLAQVLVAGYPAVLVTGPAERQTGVDLRPAALVLEGVVPLIQRTDEAEEAVVDLGTGGDRS